MQAGCPVYTRSLSTSLSRARARAGARAYLPSHGMPLPIRHSFAAHALLQD